MALPAFDTHAYYKRLVDAGVTEKQAEAQAELQSEILSNLVTEKLSTKEDLKGLATREDLVILKQDTAKLKETIAALERKITKRGKILTWISAFIAISVGIHTFSPSIHF